MMEYWFGFRGIRGPSGLTLRRAGAPIRLQKRTSNLFRPRAALTNLALDVSDFDGVFDVDPIRRTAQFLGMTTYEHLVDATLGHGLAPMCVPSPAIMTIGPRALLRLPQLLRLTRLRPATRD